MSDYKVSAGETYESISRARFGTEERAHQIRSANPGASNPPSVGSLLFMPDDSTPRAPTTAKTGEISVMIGGEKFSGWSSVTFTRAMDAFGVFSLQSMWEPDNASFRSTFRPFSYQPVAVFDGADLMFSGTLIEIDPTQTAKSRTVVASGYSLPGVINDCNAPVSAFPLERDAQDLQQIAAALLTPFGLTVEMDGDAGPAFQREAIGPTEKIFGYLVKLAQQRKLIISDTPEGVCKFQTEVETGNPVAVLVEGKDAITRIAPVFDTQNYYSHVSGQSPTIFASIPALAGGNYTVVNPRLTGILRPYTFKPGDTLGGDLKTAVEAKAGRMFANAVQYDVSIPSWRDPSGRLWEPNTTIKVTAPGAMIYKAYEFIIRAVQYKRTSTEESVVLTLALPGSFSGKIPGSLPWEE